MIKDRIIYLKFTNGTNDGFHTNYKELHLADKYKKSKDAKILSYDYYGVDPLHIKYIAIKYSQLLKNEWIDDLKYQSYEAKCRFKLK